MNLAYAFVDLDLAAVGSTMKLDMYGDLVDASVIVRSPYDPNNASCSFHEGHKLIPWQSHI